MSPRRLLLAAMLSLTVLALGHTAATLGRESTNDPYVAAAFAAMRAAVVPRTADTLPRSMADFDLGMNLNLTIALLATVALLGLLLGTVDSHPELVRRLLWPVLFFTAGVGVTSLWFFVSLPAAGLCALASLALALAASRLGRRRALDTGR